MYLFSEFILVMDGEAQEILRELKIKHTHGIAMSMFSKPL